MAGNVPISPAGTLSSTPSSPSASSPGAQPSQYAPEQTTWSTLADALAVCEREVDSKLRRVDVRLRRTRSVAPTQSPAGRSMHEQQMTMLNLLQTKGQELIKLLRECSDLESIDSATAEEGVIKVPYRPIVPPTQNGSR